MTERYRAERVWFEGETLCVRTVQGPKFEFSHAKAKLVTSKMVDFTDGTEPAFVFESGGGPVAIPIDDSLEDELTRAAEEFRRDLVKNAKPIPGLHCAECGEEVYNAFHSDSVHKGVICKNLHAGQGEPDVNFTDDDEDPAIPGFFREEQPTLPEGRARKSDCPECGGTGYVTTGVQCPCVRRRQGAVAVRPIWKKKVYCGRCGIEDSPERDLVVVFSKRSGNWEWWCEECREKGDEAVLKRAWENVDDGEDENDPFEPSPLPPDTQKKT